MGLEPREEVDKNPRRESVKGFIAHIVQYVRAQPKPGHQSRPQELET